MFQEAIGTATLILFTVIPDLSTLVNARTILTSARETPLQRQGESHRESGNDARGPT
jgi:hypothetical protein